MNPNDQSQPDPNLSSPPAPTAPVPPPQPAQPVQPIQPQTSQQPVTDPATAVQAALNEPAPETPSPTPVLADTSMQVPSQTMADDTSQPQSDVAGGEYEEDSITWTAQESIHHEKGATWFIIFSILMLALLGLSIWTQAWSFAVVIVVITVVVFMFSKRPPRELTYALTEDGLSVDGKVRSYDEFKAFGIIRDGEDFSVMLIPVQRLQPGLTMYFPEELGEDIVDILSSHMQMKELKLDAVDRMARFFRL